ncbi:MAG: hypothetical protein ABIP93_07560 [Gemmatimonadaceae bacterium]
MRLLLNVVVASTIVAGAATSDSSGARAARQAPAAADSVKEYRGLYETGFEVSWFHPCDAPRSDGTWWVTLTDAALHQRDSLAAALPGQRANSAVFVRWRGTTSMKMPAGHGGLGTRYMLVTEVLQLRPGSEASCASA